MRRCLQYAGIAAFVFFVGPFWWICAFSCNSPGTNGDKTYLSNLHVLSSDGTRMASWDREKVLAFSFEATSKTIDYLLLAAIALVGFVSKTLVIDSGKKNGERSVAACSILERWCILLALVGFAFSVLNGLGAFSYFPNLATQAEFCLYTQVARLALGQQIAFVLSLVALGVVVVTRLFQKEEVSR